MAHCPSSHENEIKNSLHALAVAILPNDDGRESTNDHFTRQRKFTGDNGELVDANV
jgi:hypothetical protein